MDIQIKFFTLVAYIDIVPIILLFLISKLLLQKFNNSKINVAKNLLIVSIVTSIIRKTCDFLPVFTDSNEKYTELLMSSIYTTFCFIDLTIYLVAIILLYRGVKSEIKNEKSNKKLE
ncbi:hypothetical protein LNTAR_24973 [Lentisphaera araneosa HTCC2155]|uniref:Uncharacterized protein n=1 Tax=Lentisphaera araneosa HTCC2155 TaxID=313628 RepID=A6DT02_9BACT|nr:hypothetical protein [Lentisphaera araneosa]EDM25292.1 hypothetical protein LNTAR_24973 [Lentisphaera araneosa HTCC2155]